MIENNQRSIYSLGVVLANITKGEIDSNIEMALYSIGDIIEESNISIEEDFLLSGYSSSLDIAIEQAREELKQISESFILWYSKHQTKPTMTIDDIDGE